MRRRKFYNWGKLIPFLILWALITGCSSPLRVLDYWTSDDFEDSEEMNFLVICQAETPSNGIEFELHIVKKLQKMNINARESHKIVPSLAQEFSIDELNSIRDTIVNSGYNGIIFSSVKNVIESYKIGESVPARTVEKPAASAISTTYVIEARVLDLNRSADNVLVGVNLVAATDPTSAEELFKAYSRIVGRHFKSKPRQ